MQCSFSGTLESRFSIHRSLCIGLYSSLPNLLSLFFALDTGHSISLFLIANIYTTLCFCCFLIVVVYLLLAVLRPFRHCLFISIIPSQFFLRIFIFAVFLSPIFCPRLFLSFLFSSSFRHLPCFAVFFSLSSLSSLLCLFSRFLSTCFPPLPLPLHLSLLSFLGLVSSSSSFLVVIFSPTSFLVVFPCRLFIDVLLPLFYEVEFLLLLFCCTCPLPSFCSHFSLQFSPAFLYFLDSSLPLCCSPFIAVFLSLSFCPCFFLALLGFVRVTNFSSPSFPRHLFLSFFSSTLFSRRPFLPVSSSLCFSHLLLFTFFQSFSISLFLV